ncbi:hypothetical protein [Streptomyces sp. NPDC058394]|uniref:hypothetical protein n=1 Tax=Streptomyces sp. NPDC058394 TaxID=3346477 RepID=UPI00364FFF82
MGPAVIASGRVIPELTIDGTDVGRARPLSGDEEERVRRLAEVVMPPANCAMIADTKPRQPRAPQVAIHAGLDAVAEAMPEAQAHRRSSATDRSPAR